MIKRIKKLLLALVLSIIFIPSVHAEHAWDTSDIKIENLTIENDNIVSFDISFKVPGELGYATGWIGIQTEEFSYDTPSNYGNYGDFTNFGNINTTYHFLDLNAVKNNTDFINQYGIIGFAPDSTTGFPCFGGITDISQSPSVSNLPIREQKTYNIYMWTNYSGSFYPDAYLGKIVVDGNGKIDIYDSVDRDGIVVASKVTFNTNGGNEVDFQLINNGEKAIKPENPSKENATFVNWYKDEALTTVFDFDNEVINEDTIIYAKWQDLGDYAFIKGENQTYTKDVDNTLDFEVDADYSLFENDGKVYIDGNLINSYTSESGSTIVKINKEYMNNLSEGNHTIKIVFNNNRKAETTFKVVKSSNPKTSDNIMLYIIMLGLSFAGFIITKKIN